jgi:rubredoxin
MGRVVEPGEPIWTVQDRAIAQAWLEYQDTKVCPFCGSPKDICHARELDGELYGEVVQCHVTAAVARVRKAEWARYEGQASEDAEVDTAGAYVAVRQRQPTS